MLHTVYIISCKFLYLVVHKLCLLVVCRSPCIYCLARVFFFFFCYRISVWFLCVVVGGYFLCSYYTLVLFVPINTFELFLIIHIKKFKRKGGGVDRRNGYPLAIYADVSIQYNLFKRKTIMGRSAGGIQSRVSNKLALGIHVSSTPLHIEQYVG